MKGLTNQSEDEEVRKGIMKLKELLKDPAKFEKWANETLDKSRLRRK
jgi:hypothetical protein